MTTTPYKMTPNTQLISCDVSRPYDMKESPEFLGFRASSRDALAQNAQSGSKWKARLTAGEK